MLLDNGGGGIFDFLPVAGAAIARESEPAAVAGLDLGLEQDIYTRHIATPTGLDFAGAASLYGLSHERAEDVPAFARRSSARWRARTPRSSRSRRARRPTSSCTAACGSAVSAALAA